MSDPQYLGDIFVYLTCFIAVTTLLLFAIVNLKGWVKPRRKRHKKTLDDHVRKL